MFFVLPEGTDGSAFEQDGKYDETNNTEPIITAS
jgi:hypothetical protein